MQAVQMEPVQMEPVQIVEVVEVVEVVESYQKPHSDSQESQKSVTKADVHDVFIEFVQPRTVEKFKQGTAEEEMYKLLVETLKGADKVIRGFNEFLQAKAYRKRYPDATDEMRYGDMIASCMRYLSDTNLLDKYLVNKQMFFDALGTFLSGPDAQEHIYELFLKGSFKAIAEKVGRILKPKEDDDPCPGLDVVSKYVKQYGLDFIDKFVSVFSKPNCNFYSVKIEIFGLDDPTILLKELVYTLCAKDYLFFAIVKGINDDPSLNTVMEVLIAMSGTIPEYDSNVLSLMDFVKCVESNEYEPVYIENYISMLALKKLFTVKDRDTTTEMAILLTLIEKSYGLYLYEANYVDMSGFNNLTENYLPNVLKGVIKCGEEWVDGPRKGQENSVPSKEFPHGVLATFQLNGTPGDLKIKSFWLTFDPVECCVPEFDREPFDWNLITLDEYLPNMKKQGDLCTEYLYHK